MKNFKKIEFIKYFYLIAITLLNINNINGQVVPQGLMQQINAYPRSIYSNASFNLAPNNNINPYSYYRSYIISNSKFSFNNLTSYSLQFLIKGRKYKESNCFFCPVVDYGTMVSFATNSIYEIGNPNIFLKYYLKGPSIATYRKVFSKYDTIIPSNNFKFEVSYQITSTYDGSKFCDYVNGILVSTINKPQNTEWQVDNLYLVLGTKDGITPIIIDEVRFWDKALTAEEISTNWNTSLTGNEVGLKLYYNFDNQGYPNQNNQNIGFIKDITTNNNNGSINYSALNGPSNNFVDDISFNNHFKKFNFDLNNLDCYPGTSNLIFNNIPTQGKLYNLDNFSNNLQFYKNTNYDRIAQPTYNADGGRSIGIQDIYGKSNLNTGIDGDMSISIEAWVKLNALNNMSIVSIGENYDGNQFEMALSDNKLQLNIGGNNKLINTSSLLKNKWYYMVCTYDNWQYNIYINGINERTGWYVGPPPYSAPTENDIFVPQNTVNTPLYIGTSQSSFNGKLGSLIIYNSLLSASEILNKFNATKARFGY
jgi:hypothetical protein